MIKLNPGFKQFLVKTGLLIFIFIIIQLITMNITAETRLPYTLTPFYLVDIAKIGLFTLIIFAIAYREKLLKIRENKLEVKSLVIFGVIDVLLIFIYFWLKKIILINLNFALNYSFLFAFILYFMLFLIILSLTLAVYGYKFCKNFYKESKKEIWIFIEIFILVFFVSNQIQRLWFLFSGIVTRAVYFLLSLSSNPTINLSGKIPVIGLNNFIVGIDNPCSGIESIFMFSFLYIFAVCFDWKILNKKKAILLFFPGVISVFILNILRVYSMILVGAYISREFALGIFHTNAGWILFLAYFTLFWFLFYNWMKKPEFRKENKKQIFIKKIYNKIMSDSLYRNSIYLMLSTLIMSILGFIFWMINARLFTTEQVGLATTIISVMSLITSFSLIGLNTGLTRYLPTAENKDKKINTSFTLVAIVTVVISTIFLLSTKTLFPKLMFIQDNIILAFAFILFMIFGSLSSLIDNVFIAYRSTKFILLKNTVFSLLKILLLFAFVGLGAYGIFTSWMISITISFLIVFLILIYKFNYKPKLVIYDSIIKKIGKYSFANYIAGFIGSLPTLFLPLLILNKLGPETSAYYYMAMMIATLLFIIPQSTSNSLFAEGSHNQKEIKEHFKKSVKIIALLMIPAILMTIFLGQYILLAFGKNYSSEGYMFLSILSLSGIFISINSVYNTLFRINHRIKELIIVSMISAILILGLSYLLIDQGLLGIGYAWVVGQAFVSGVYVVLSFRKK